MVFVNLDEAVPRGFELGRGGRDLCFATTAGHHAVVLVLRRRGQSVDITVLIGEGGGGGGGGGVVVGGGDGGDIEEPSIKHHTHKQHEGGRAFQP